MLCNNLNYCTQSKMYSYTCPTWELGVLYMTYNHVTSILFPGPVLVFDCHHNYVIVHVLFPNSNIHVIIMTVKCHGHIS